MTKYLWLLPLAVIWGGGAILCFKLPFKDEIESIFCVLLTVTSIALLTRWL
jgi:hypothetical protein